MNALHARPERQRWFRPTAAADVRAAGHRFEWLKPDGWREGFRSLALEIDHPASDERLLIGVGRVGPNLVHPQRDMVEIEIDEAYRRKGHGTALINELRKYSTKPLSDKVVPGSVRDLFLGSIGAVTYLPLPSMTIDLTAARTARWCRAAWEAGRPVGDRQQLQVVRWSDLPREWLVEALTDRYLWQHASWSPTAGRETIRPVVGEEFYDEAVLEHSWATVRAGRITALADLYDEPAGKSREGCLEAIDAAAPQARPDVALCLAALIEDVRELGADQLDCDNHPTDPHAAPLLATLPLIAGEQMNLVEIPNGITAALRETT